MSEMVATVEKKALSSALFAVPEQEMSKEKILSVRVPEEFFTALETQAQEWNLSNSQALRKILSFYFLPVAYELEWKEKKIEELKQFLEEKKRGETSQKFSSYGEFISQVSEYVQFLKRTRERVSVILEFLERNIGKVENILNEFEKNIEQVAKELE